MQEKVTVRCLRDAGDFLAAAGVDLLKDEIRNSLAYGVAKRIAVDAHAFGPDAPWFLIAQDANGIRGTALRTPPHGVILAHVRGEVSALCAVLVPSVRKLEPSIPGVVAEKTLADQFTEDWCIATGERAQVMMALRIHQLTQVNCPVLVPGSMRKATIDDAELVQSWREAFRREALNEEPALASRERTRERIEEGSIVLWEDDTPVSMAMSARPAGNGITIRDVYTPPEHRSRGYATSCVASLCRKLLREYKYCVLYTDLANPVSNAIYQRIGFRKYCDSAHYTYGNATA